MNIISTIKLGAVATIATMAFTSCNSLDLSPIDSYGSGNYWTKPEHIIGYMDGLHKNLRDQVYQHQYILGEARGGSSIGSGTSVDGVNISYMALKVQNLSSVSPGIENWGNMYGMIANINIFLQKTKEATYMADSEKAYYLAQAYGLRAFYYFDLYRVYGTAPLQLDPNKVFNGNFNPEELYEGRASASTLMKQIKSDLDESMKYFGDNNSFDPKNRNNKKGYWSKAATECLMGDVYLWTAKVSVDDNPANEADLIIAKKHLLSVVDNYNLGLEKKFDDVFDVNNKGNKEIILAVRFAEGEASNNQSTIYNMQTGAFRGGNFRDENGKILDTDTLQTGSTGMQYNEYKKELFLKYSKKDVRRDGTFLSVYGKDDMKLRGTYVRKNIGYFNVATNMRVWNGDAILYRLPWVYLALAEIANMEGDNTSVEKYINLVRERAYPYYEDANKTVWQKTTYGYTASDFTANELTILDEKDKEFVQEGQRWWDVCRMTLTKGGKHLVFCNEGNIVGEGEENKPILNEATDAHKVLWPIETNMISKDPKVKQTPGYK